MYKIAVIGAGQLGSRHLQGLKLSKLKSDIWVVDNNPNSLQIAQQRYYKPQNKMFHFCKTFCSKITLVNTIQNVI